MMNETDDRRLESRVRSLAQRKGYRVTKSRERKYVPHGNNHGDYMLVDDRNTVVFGSAYDATLEQIADYLSAD